MRNQHLGVAAQELATENLTLAQRKAAEVQSGSEVNTNRSSKVMADRPRLKQGETPQSPSYLKRLEEFNRQVALEEATKAKQEQDVKESEARAERNVLDEVSKGVAEADKVTGKKPEPKPAKPKRALRDRAKTIDDAVDEAVTGK